MAMPVPVSVLILICVSVSVDIESVHTTPHTPQPLLTLITPPHTHTHTSHTSHTSHISHISHTSSLSPHHTHAQWRIYGAQAIILHTQQLVTPICFGWFLRHYLHAMLDRAAENDREGGWKEDGVQLTDAAQSAVV